MNRIRNHDKELTRGDYHKFGVRVRLNGEPALKDGDELIFTVKKTARSSRVGIQKRLKVFIDNELAIFEIFPEDTKELGFGGYVYDIEWRSIEHSVKTIITPSEFRILKEVTHE